VNRNLIISACISAFLVAIGGTFYAQYFRYIDPYSIAGFSLSLNMALVVVIGGSGTIFGPTIGAFLLIPMTELLRHVPGGTIAGIAPVPLRDSAGSLCYLSAQRDCQSARDHQSQKRKKSAPNTTDF
jgi:ABC-type branched-subunit amino acid transport system permease subunit